MNNIEMRVGYSCSWNADLMAVYDYFHGNLNGVC